MVCTPNDRTAAEECPRAKRADRGTRRCRGLAGIVALWALWTVRRGRSPTSRWLLRASLLLPFLPLLANTVGWVFTEMGRQPWIVFGLMTTSDGVSPGTTVEVLVTLIGFTVLYDVLAAIEFGLLARVVRAGLPDTSAEPVDETSPCRSRTERSVMQLTTVWFVLIAVLWVGYFVLEGFDFGVGVLLPVLGRTDAERRVLINTIGPVWDGNEVWLLVAGGATFAAFPHWYATLFSAFHLPLFLILVALIVRGVAFEYRGQRPDPRWRRSWDRGDFPRLSRARTAVGGRVRQHRARCPDRREPGVRGRVLDLLNPYALLGGLTTLGLFVTHGALFLALKTTGTIRAQANALAGRVGCAAPVLAVAFLAWTLVLRPDPAALALSVVAALALLAGLGANRARHEGWAFLGTAATLASPWPLCSPRSSPTSCPRPSTRRGASLRRTHRRRRTRCAS